MCSYNKINGEYAGASYHLLTEILRNEWGFEGAVISDWGACIDAAKCLKAGMDLAMPDSHGYFDKQLKKALADHIIDMGPEGGRGGGKVVVTGTPEEVARCKASKTSRFLKPLL